MRDTPRLRVAADRVVAALMAKPAQLLEYPDQGQAFTRLLVLVRQQQSVKLIAPWANPRQRLLAALIAKLGRLRPDHLAHDLPRHPKLAANRLDRLLLRQMCAPDLRYRFHHQHPEPGPMSPMEAIVDPPFPGSRSDADHPQNGVLIPCPFTARSASQQFRARPFIAVTVRRSPRSKQPGPIRVGCAAAARHRR
jgi:hypothetical protein